MLSAKTVRALSIPTYLLVRAMLSAETVRALSIPTYLLVRAMLSAKTVRALSIPTYLLVKAMLSAKTVRALSIPTYLLVKAMLSAKTVRALSIPTYLLVRAMLSAKTRCWSLAKSAPVFSKRPKKASNAGAAGGDIDARDSRCSSIAQMCFDTMQRRSTTTPDPLVALVQDHQSGVITGLMHMVGTAPSPQCWSLCRINPENQLTMYCQPNISEPLQMVAHDHFLQSSLVAASPRVAQLPTPITSSPFPEARKHGGTLDTYTALACAVAAAPPFLAGKAVPESLDISVWHFAIQGCSTSPDEPTTPRASSSELAALARTRLPLKPDSTPVFHA
ncbi:hypothetical protein AC579_1150 [Pseudocercospora musae]|uniref:Uncharacterized protein n=1 Tax=Pseudocercospora musae TaxID=113226 RepID=A0A139H435_9PEZI|nr:hypothetical protein AC579_1150 [Pseudocercospora musae]